MKKTLSERRKQTKNATKSLTKLSVPLVRKAIEGSGGVLTIVAKRCNVSRMALYNFFQKKPDLFEELKQARESRVDVAEINMFKLSEEGDFQANKYILDTLGRNRGYGVKSQVEVHQKSINLNVELKKEDVEELTEFLKKNEDD